MKYFSWGESNPIWELAQRDVAHSQWDNTPSRGISERCLAASTTTIEARNKPRTSTICDRGNSRPRLQTTEHHATSRRHEYALKSSMTSSPSLFSERRFKAPSAHLRDPGGHGLVAWSANGKERLAAVRTRRRKPWPLSHLVVVRQRALCDLLRYSDFPHI